jgi:hypothetical protein
LLDEPNREVMRHEYKSDEEAEQDNKRMAQGTLGWKWILNNGTKAK